MQDAVEVICVGGLSLQSCSQTINTSLNDAYTIVEVLENLWKSNDKQPVLIVSPSMRGSVRLLKEIALGGWNPFIVEITGLPESVLSGLPLELLVEYWIGFIIATLGDRLRAQQVLPSVSRREVLRRLFLVPSVFAILPRVKSDVSVCKDSCPFNAIGDKGLDETRCRGCMLCVWRCRDRFDPPTWTSITPLLYVYQFLDKHGLDGILFICRNRLDNLDSIAPEASPARLVPYHIPCAGWLSPRLLGALRMLDVYVHVYAGKDVCENCRLKEAGITASASLSESGIDIGGSLVRAGSAAYTGYTRLKRSLEEVSKHLYSNL